MILVITGDCGSESYESLDAICDEVEKADLVVCDPDFVVSLLERTLVGEDTVEMYRELGQFMG